VDEGVICLVDALREVKGFSEVLDEHLSWLDAVVPHLLTFDLVELLDSNLGVAGDLDNVVRPALRAIEEVLEKLSDVNDADEWKDYFLTMLHTSFFENFEPFGENVSRMRKQFGPLLEREYQVYFRATRSEIKTAIKGKGRIE